MIDEQLEGLLWKEIDGGLDARERQVLEERLAADPEARTARERLASLNEGLASLEMVAPPGELRPKVRAAIAAPRPRASRSFLDSVRAALTPLTGDRVRFAYLVAGIFVGALVSLAVAWNLEPGASVDPSSVYGAANVGADRWLEVELPAGSGELHLRREGSRLISELSSSSSLELRIERTESGSVRLLLSEDGVTRLERQVDWEEIPGR